MDLRNIEAFLMVVKKGSFSIAANSLFITQPTISSRIQRLEEEIGVTLFDRNGGKKAILTPFGQAAFPFFKEGYQKIKEGTDMLQTRIEQKRIHLSCPNHMGQFIMPAILKVLYQIYPEIEFILLVDRTSRIVENVRNAEIDIGFIYLAELPIDKQISFIPLTSEETVLVAAPYHPLSKKEVITIPELAEEKMIIYAKTFITTMVIDRFLSNNGLKEYQTIEIKNLEWLKMMVRNGLGISFLQRNIVSEELRNQTLIELQTPYQLPTTPISLVFRNSVPKNIKNTIIKTAQELFSRN